MRHQFAREIHDLINERTRKNGRGLTGEGLCMNQSWMNEGLRMEGKRWPGEIE